MNLATKIFGGLILLAGLVSPAATNLNINNLNRTNVVYDTNRVLITGAGPQGTNSTSIPIGNLFSNRVHYGSNDFQGGITMPGDQWAAFGASANGFPGTFLVGMQSGLFQLYDAVNGTGWLRYDDADQVIVIDGALRLTLGAGVGKVLTSDGSGNATWQAGGAATNAIGNVKSNNVSVGSGFTTLETTNNGNVKFTDVAVGATVKISAAVDIAADTSILNLNGASNYFNSTIAGNGTGSNGPVVFRDAADPTYYFWTNHQSALPYITAGGSGFQLSFYGLKQTSYNSTQHVFSVQTAASEYQQFFQSGASSVSSNNMTSVLFTNRTFVIRGTNIVFDTVLGQTDPSANLRIKHLPGSGPHLRLLDEPGSELYRTTISGLASTGSKLVMQFGSDGTAPLAGSNVLGITMNGQQITEAGIGTNAPFGAFHVRQVGTNFVIKADSGIEDSVFTVTTNGVVTANQIKIKATGTQIDANIVAGGSIVAGSTISGGAATFASVTITGAPAGGMTLSNANGSAATRFLNVATNSYTRTNWFGSVDVASASVIEAAFNLFAQITQTNRMTGNQTITLTNGNRAHYRMSGSVIGEAAGGASRTLTLVAHTGQLIIDLDDFSAAPATSKTITVTNGNVLEFDDEISFALGTNFHRIVTRQAKL